MIWDELLKAERHILDRWSDVDLPSPANDVGRHFINRGGQLLATAAGLLKLHREYEGPMVIRAMFELALQFEYLMRDPQSRAQQYLDYAHITKYRYFRAVASHPTGPISQAIASSPMRAAGEIRNEEEYRRVLERFLRPKGKQPWSNWYCKSIRDLADELGWAGEYRVLYAIGSSWAHADPVHTDAHSPFGQGSPDVVYVVCLHYYARMLLRVSEQLILTDTEYKLLKALAQEVS